MQGIMLMKILFISILMIQALTPMTLAQQSLNSREAEEQARILVGTSFSKCGDSYFTGYINSISTSPGLILEVKGLEYSTQQITPTASDKLNGISGKATILITFSSVGASKKSQPAWSRWGGPLNGYLSSPIMVS
jgi:hypothetical protein